MHLQDRPTAQVMRRAAVGPHALMLRRALSPYVPDRGTAARRSFRSYSGLGASNLMQSAGSAYTGASVGAAASGLFLGGATTVAGSVAGAAAAGSFVPVIGTAIGAIIGLAMSGVFAHRQDPEVANFNAAVQLFNTQGPAGILNIADKYLVLAGLFDLEPSQIKGNIPIYKKYGRMGEQRFVQDMCNLIYAAGQSGQITNNDTIQSVYSRVILPWINSFGYGSMQDTNGEMINTIILGLAAEYITGLWKQRWFARSGDFPNWQIQPFSLPSTTAMLPPTTMPTASPTPSPVSIISSTPAPSLPPEVVDIQAGRIPAVGTTIHYAWNIADGQVLMLPYPGTFQGRTSKGAWIIQMSGSTFVLDGTLQSYTPAQTQQVSAVAPTITPSTPAVSTSGGGPAPTVGAPQSLFSNTPAPVISPTSTGFSPASSTSFAPTNQAFNPLWVVGGGVGLLVLILAMKKNRRGTRT